MLHGYFLCKENDPCLHAYIVTYLGIIAKRNSSSYYVFKSSTWVVHFFSCQGHAYMTSQLEIMKTGITFLLYNYSQWVTHAATLLHY